MIMHTRQEKMEAFGRLLDVMDDLREKCPWDRKQTNETADTFTNSFVETAFLESPRIIIFKTR